MTAEQFIARWQHVSGCELATAPSPTAAPGLNP